MTTISAQANREIGYYRIRVCPHHFKAYHGSLGSRHNIVQIVEDEIALSFAAASSAAFTTILLFYEGMRVLDCK